MPSFSFLSSSFFLRLSLSSFFLLPLLLHCFFLHLVFFLFIFVQRILCPKSRSSTCWIGHGCARITPTPTSTTSPWSSGKALVRFVSMIFRYVTFYGTFRFDAFRYVTFYGTFRCFYVTLRFTFRYVTFRYVTFYVTVRYQQKQKCAFTWSSIFLFPLPLPLPSSSSSSLFPLPHPHSPPSSPSSSLFLFPLPSSSSSSSSVYRPSSVFLFLFLVDDPLRERESSERPIRRHRRSRVDRQRRCGGLHYTAGHGVVAVVPVVVFSSE